MLDCIQLLAEGVCGYRVVKLHDAIGFFNEAFLRDVSGVLLGLKELLTSDAGPTSLYSLCGPIHDQKNVPVVTSCSGICSD